MLSVVLLALVCPAVHAAAKVYTPVPTISPALLAQQASELNYEVAHHRFGFIVGVARSGVLDAVAKEPLNNQQAHQL
jgi:hypothetical protein